MQILKVTSQGFLKLAPSPHEWVGFETGKASVMAQLVSSIWDLHEAGLW